jgi:non-ribosomal peptide synthetase component F
MDRSFDSIASLFGIWKAGGVYLPLDPSYPKERLNYFLKDAEPLAILCNREFSGTVEFPTEKTIVLETDIGLGGSPNADSYVFPELDLENQAYLLYTSGSTGEPKGVQMPHRAVANLIAWQNTQERLSSAARALQFAPRSFDVSIQEIVSTLTVGGTILIPC